VSASPPLLSTLRPTRGERRLAVTVVVVSGVFFLAALPFAKVALTPLPAFIPIYQSAIVVNDGITAILLVGQFMARRIVALLVLAGAYVFTALLAAAHMLTFPGLFASGGLLGAGTQTTVWLYMAWHGVFPAGVIVYAWMARRPDGAVTERAVRPAIATMLATVAVAATAVVAIATAGHEMLPILLHDGRYSIAYIVTVGTVWALAASTLVALWRGWRRRLTVLDLWLIVVMCAWLFDIALAAMLNAKRFDLGFYAGRIYGLLASGFVLMVLLIESTLLHVRLAKLNRRERGERRRLAEKERELTAANRELDAFAYSISHDLRAPLRAIDGYARMLEEDHAARLDREGMRLLGVVRASTASMAQLIEDLLAFSRAGRTPLAKHDIDFESLVRAVIADQAAQDVGRDIEFDVGALDHVRGDPSLLRQLVANLISNAVKFTGGRQPARIAIGREGSEGDGRCVYFVRDNGAGFDMAYAAKLFGVFQRLHGPEEFPGTGVGLAIAARIVARHGGRIWAEAEPGQGATFRFTLDS